MSEPKANSFKFSTVIWIIVGLLLPLWPVSLPLCFWMAYKSYQNGEQDEQYSSVTVETPAIEEPIQPEKFKTLNAVKEAKELLDSGVITEEEFNKIKSEALAMN
ncbi:SHOCT domain-containing protein [Vibrio vulnificus]|nr:SHOCT domain-containing protein [Vibrio vulnificus]EHV9838355.1 SHOCT domain-containing protein [Vibrio vulnificus]ELF6474307.1 SHOCT domain-containing protein [Vibrio vulnificus]HAS8434262.1 SHOCT domain-containing protein [Vibrio vulnificus]HAS8438759.1 SHOCT domain-containing protein [Vibrio vulnificus]